MGVKTLWGRNKVKKHLYLTGHAGKERGGGEKKGKETLLVLQPNRSRSGLKKKMEKRKGIGKKSHIQPRKDGSTGEVVGYGGKP